MRGFTYRPRLLDHFPKTRRGHGTTHPNDRHDKNGQRVRVANPCVNEICELRSRTGKGDPHEGQQANVHDWKEERGFNKHTPLEACR